MKCPRCQHPIELGWQALRRERRAHGLCVECGEDAVGYYRCVTCRTRIKTNAAYLKQGKHSPISSSSLH